MSPLLKCQPATAVLTVTDTDASGETFRFSQPVYISQESDTAMTITVERIGATSGATVRYAAEGMTTSSRSDYTYAFGTLSFAAGEESKTFVVLVNPLPLLFRASLSWSCARAAVAHFETVLGSPDGDLEALAVL